MDETQKINEERQAEFYNPDLETTFNIWELNFSKFEEEIERLNKRARRLDLAEITFEITGEEFVKIKNENSRYDGHTLKKFSVEITGQSPKLEGWTFVAAIDHEPEGNIIRSIPGSEFVIPEHYREADSDCDHCETRRRRTSTFLLISEDGEWVQVGRQCIKDFTGHKSPQRIASYASYLAEFIERWQEDPDRFFGGHAPLYFNLLGWLSKTAAVIDERGWMGRTKAREWGKIATADIVDNQFFNKELDDEDIIEDTEEHYALAGEVVDWIDGELAEKDPMSDYEWNLVKLVSNGRKTEFNLRYSGYVSSMIMAYKREKGLLEEAKNKADPNWKPSEYQGEIKKRQDWVLTCTRKHGFEVDVPNTSYWTTKFVYTMEDDNYNTFVWFTTNNVIDEGETLKIKGTVKEHKEYRGVKQTVLTRCKVLETIEEEANAD
jgi:hypothetical protein